MRMGPTEERRNCGVADPATNSTTQNNNNNNNNNSKDGETSVVVLDNSDNEDNNYDTNNNNEDDDISIIATREQPVRHHSIIDLIDGPDIIEVSSHNNNNGSNIRNTEDDDVAIIEERRLPPSTSHSNSSSNLHTIPLHLPGGNSIQVSINDYERPNISSFPLHGQQGGEGPDVGSTGIVRRSATPWNGRGGRNSNDIHRNPSAAGLSMIRELHNRYPESRYPHYLPAAGDSEDDEESEMTFIEVISMMAERENDLRRNRRRRNNNNTYYGDSSQSRRRRRRLNSGSHQYADPWFDPFGEYTNGYTDYSREESAPSTPLPTHPTIQDDERRTQNIINFIEYRENRERDIKIKQLKDKTEPLKQKYMKSAQSMETTGQYTSNFSTFTPVEEEKQKVQHEETVFPSCVLCGVELGVGIPEDYHGITEEDKLSEFEDLVKKYDYFCPYQSLYKPTQLDKDLSKRTFISRNCGHLFCGRCFARIDNAKGKSKLSKKKLAELKGSSNPNNYGPRLCPAKDCRTTIRAKGRLKEIYF